MDCDVCGLPVCDECGGGCDCKECSCDGEGEEELTETEETDGDM